MRLTLNTSSNFKEKQLKIVTDNQKIMLNLANSKPSIKTARQMEQEYL